MLLQVELTLTLCIARIHLIVLLQRRCTKDHLLEALWSGPSLP